MRAGDRVWPMPIFDDYREQLKSEIADFTNTGGRPAGAITAALFLKEFAGDLPWVHIDIAGTAWAEEAKPYQPKGATGVAVRTLAELAFDAAAMVTVQMSALCFAGRSQPECPIIVEDHRAAERAELSGLGRRAARRAGPRRASWCLDRSVIVGGRSSAVACCFMGYRIRSDVASPTRD